MAGMAWLFWTWDVESARENYTHSLRFASAAWKSRAKDDGIMWPTRLRMADDLQASGILKGKTRAEVRDLLGEDDSSLYDLSQGQMTYLLRPERSAFGLDLEALFIRFGADGRVSGWDIHRA
jgi:hypothetical protein